ncbi:MAG: hypothetical protein M3H12_13155, partial [Chromatiales bacterium]
GTTGMLRAAYAYCGLPAFVSLSMAGSDCMCTSITAIAHKLRKCILYLPEFFPADHPVVFRNLFSNLQLFFPNQFCRDSAVNFLPKDKLEVLASHINCTNHT